MVILNTLLLIFASFYATAQAETCDVGVDGCTWTCKQATLGPDQATCLAIPGTPTSCEIGSSASICGTTCTCSKAPTCTVGEAGCSWDCKTEPTPPGQVSCLAYPSLNDTCVVGSTVSACATTCTCVQAPTCKVGENGCSWDCKTAPTKPGTVTCLAYPATPDTCVVGSTVSACATTCTCVQAPTCKVGEKGCSWDCTTAPTKPGMATCLAYPSTPDTCVVGSSVSLCGTTCKCAQAPTCKIGQNGCTWDCKKAPLKPGQVTCLALPIQPETCVVGTSVTTCGTTCTCLAKPPSCTCGSKCSCNGRGTSSIASILDQLLSFLKRLRLC